MNYFRILKIKRENGSYDEVRISIRLLEIPDNKIPFISKILSANDIEHEVNAKYNNIVITFKNESEFRYICNILLRDEFNNVVKNLYISINSGYDHGGLRVPEYITDCMKLIQFSMDFVFILG